MTNTTNTALRAALAAPAQTVAHDALRCGFVAAEAYGRLHDHAESLAARILALGDKVVTAALAQAGEALRVDWLLAVQPVAEVDGLGHFMTAWLTESKSPNGVAGYFVTRGASHRECLDLHLAGKGKAVDG